MATLNLAATASQQMMDAFRANFNASGSVDGHMDFVRDTGADVPGTTIVKIDFEATAFGAAASDGSITMAVTGGPLEGTVGSGAGGTIKFCLFKTYAGTPLAMATVGKTGDTPAPAIIMPNNVMADGEKVQISSLVIRLTPTYTPV